MFGGTCIVADRLIILPRDGQSRAVIDAAAARYGGFGVPFYSARADIYAIDFRPWSPSNSTGFAKSSFRTASTRPCRTWPSCSGAATSRRPVGCAPDDHAARGGRARKDGFVGIRTPLSSHVPWPDRA